MPRKNGKTSRVTEWAVHPWLPVQRTRHVPPTTAKRRADDGEEENDSPRPFTEEAAAKLQRGLDDFRTTLDLPHEVREPAQLEGKEDWWRCPCLLAFEESNGHFVGFSLVDDSLKPHLVLTGRRHMFSSLDCRFHDAQGWYDIDIAEIQNPENSQRVCAIHTGGDVARLDTEGTSSPLDLCFRCVELFGNSSSASALRPYFEGEDVIVNVGVLWISGWKNA